MAREGHGARLTGSLCKQTRERPHEDAPHARQVAPDARRDHAGTDRRRRQRQARRARAPLQLRGRQHVAQLGARVPQVPASALTL